MLPMTEDEADRQLWRDGVERYANSHRIASVLNAVQTIGVLVLLALALRH